MNLPHPASRLGVITPLLVLISCVTVNVYFPAAAAQDAARTIVRDVLKSQGQQQGEQPPPSDDGKPAGNGQDTSGDQRSSGPTRLAMGLVNAVIAPARAQSNANIDISTPAIKRIRTSLKSRSSSLKPYYSSGAIGFTDDGLVAIRDQSQIALKDRNTAKRLVSRENQDRNALYREIARANDHPEWEGDIRSTFARVWIQEAPAGYWYQGSGGDWQQK